MSRKKNKIIEYLLIGFEINTVHLNDETEQRKYIAQIEYLTAKQNNKLNQLAKLLKNKNIALKELLYQIETEKKTILNEINANVEKFILPIIKKIELNSNALDKKYISLLLSNFKNITEPFGININKFSHNFTPRELEICNMIKNGLRTNEISKLLNLSIKTVERHRHNIRKKIKITNKKLNLSSFIKNL